MKVLALLLWVLPALAHAQVDSIADVLCALQPKVYRYEDLPINDANWAPPCGSPGCPYEPGMHCLVVHLDGPLRPRMEWACEEHPFHEISYVTLIPWLVAQL